MEFLKTVFSDKALTYEEFVQAINAHNGDESNKENQIKIGNLGNGEYVAKGKYDNLQALLDSSKGDVQTLTETIESLKKGKVDAETLQSKVAEAEKALAESQTREHELKVKYALDVAFLSEGVSKENAELLAIALERRLKEKDEVLELDANDGIKGWEDKLTTLKTSFPTMFGTGDGGNGGFEPVDGNGLPNPNPNKTVTKEQFMKMGYEERVQFKKDNESLYRQYTGK